MVVVLGQRFQLLGDGDGWFHKGAVEGQVVHRQDLGVGVVEYFFEGGVGFELFLGELVGLEMLVGPGGIKLGQGQAEPLADSGVDGVFCGCVVGPFKELRERAIEGQAAGQQQSKER